MRRDVASISRLFRVYNFSRLYNVRSVILQKNLMKFPFQCCNTKQAGNGLMRRCRYGSYLKGAITKNSYLDIAIFIFLYVIYEIPAPQGMVLETLICHSFLSRLSHLAAQCLGSLHIKKRENEQVTSTLPHNQKIGSSIMSF